MLEIGNFCKINLSDTRYRITDKRRKVLNLKNDKNTTHQVIEYFVDLEEVENTKNVVPNISTTKIYPVE